jgi:hypothetical protein
MDVGGTWERLLHTPTTWIVVAAVLFVVAVVLLVAGARAGRAARRQRERAAAEPVVVGPAAEDDDPVTEPSVPRRGPAPSGAVEEVAGLDPDEDPVTEPAARRDAVVVPDRPDHPDHPDAAATQRLLGALVADPSGALAGVTALERGGDPGPAAVTLLRSGVPAPAVARLCGVDADDLGDLVAATLGILPDRARPEAAADAGPEETAEQADAPERAAAPMS